MILSSMILFTFSFNSATLSYKQPARFLYDTSVIANSKRWRQMGSLGLSLGFEGGPFGARKQYAMTIEFASVGPLFRLSITFSRYTCSEQKYKIVADNIFKAVASCNVMSENVVTYANLVQIVSSVRSTTIYYFDEVIAVRTFISEFG